MDNTKNGSSADTKRQPEKNGAGKVDKKGGKSDKKGDKNKEDCSKKKVLNYY